jgi:predicted kinase
MNLNEEIINSSIAYLNQNKKKFLDTYTKDVNPSTDKIALFTAGMSGVGKTELATFLTESNSNLLHIDTDEIREFFREIGYDGQNANLYQKVASRGFSELFTYALKNNFSLIMDSNFANLDMAMQNIRRLLKKSYQIEILYLYDYPELCFEYATRRELVTHRKVPKDIFERSNINSYKTIIEIKKHFKEQVTLNFFDKRHNNIYNNIEIAFLKNTIGVHFDTK